MAIGRRIAVVLALIGLLGGACSAEPAVTSAPETLPPHERADLAAMFDPLLLPLGYEITRASLIDRSTYEVDPEGGHLALYVAPLDDISPDRYAGDFLEVVRLFLPMVFGRWSELESFDLCQEPFDSPEETPPSLTLIDLTSEAAAGVDWGSLDLERLIGLDGRDGILVWARDPVRDSTTWRQAAGL